MQGTFSVSHMWVASAAFLSALPENQIESGELWHKLVPIQNVGITGDALMSYATTQAPELEFLSALHHNSIPVPFGLAGPFLYDASLTYWSQEEDRDGHVEVKFRVKIP